MDANSVRKLVDKQHPDVMKVWNKMVAENLQNLIPEINSGRRQVSGQHAEKALNNFSNEHDKKINRNPNSQVKEAAAKRGININNEEFTTNIHGKEGKLKEQYEKVTAKNTEQYNNIKQVNILEQGDLHRQIDKYKKDRIGQGKFIGGPLGIGGATKGSEKSTRVNKGAYQNARQVKPKDE